MKVVEQCCRRIAESGKIEWFGAREAKVFCKLYWHKKLSLVDLSLLTAIEVEETREAMHELGRRRVVEFDGTKYFLPTPLQSLNRLVSKARIEKIIVAVKRP